MDIKKTSKGWNLEPVTQSEETTLKKLIEFISEIQRPNQSVATQDISLTTQPHRMASDRQTAFANE